MIDRPPGFETVTEPKRESEPIPILNSPWAAGLAWPHSAFLSVPFLFIFAFNCYYICVGSKVSRA